MFLNESRKEYTKYEFDTSHALDNPFQQFNEWFEFAKKNAVFEPNAMHVSTVDAEGQPKNRVVLLKSFSDDGFVFTNYNSDKSQQLLQNPKVALTFFGQTLNVKFESKG